MTRVEEFDTFYNSTRRYMLHLTYALCGDRNTAAGAVADAYRHAWQQWPKLRGRDSLAYLRNEAWRLSVFERGKHPWRRRHEEDSDLALITALQKLSPSARRLVVLQAIGEVGLGSAARDVGLTDEAALEATQDAVASLQDTMATGLDDIERRMRGLARISDRIMLPRPHGLRREARRRTRRRTVTAVAVAAAAVVTAGMVATESPPMDHAEASAHREQLGAETRDVTPVGAEIGPDHLLDARQASRLDPGRRWQVGDTADDASAGEPYAQCAPRRFSDRKAREGFVRSFSASGTGNERAIEAVEVSRSPAAAKRAYERMVRWYSDCAMPRIQLIDSYTVQRPAGDTRIFRLRVWREPARTVTVAVSRTGVATTALVHSVDGSDGVDVDDLAATVGASLRSVCRDAGGRCPRNRPVDETLPVPANHAKAFLSVVDLPPVADIDGMWVGTDAVKAAPNPSATLCDEAKFDGPRLERARSRVFVIPEEPRLPEEFGLSETVGRFTKSKAARAFVRSVGAKIEHCEKDNLSASVGKSSTFSTKTAAGERMTGKTWKVSFEVDKKKKVDYRVALVRRGRDVAQMSFSPAKGFDVDPQAFQWLARRSAQRLAYMR